MKCVKCNEPRYSTSSYCRTHHNALVSDYRQRNRDKINEKNKKYMAERRGNPERVCEICGATGRLRLSQAPNGDVRGMLCSDCSTIVKFVESNLDRVALAQQYIFKWNFEKEAEEFAPRPDDFLEPFDIARKFIWGASKNN